MKLLILTQKIDLEDDVLGFFHRWVEEFSKHCELVTVIALYVGEHNLPKNVRVFSLGKESGASRLKYLMNFYKYIWRERNNYDSVFVHMNPEYVILGGLFWKMSGKKIALWYTHKKVSLRLIIAEKLSDIILSASPESFRIKSPKLRITGHGIDTTLFSPMSSNKKNNNNSFKILSVGRISPIKDYETLISAIKIVRRQIPSVTLDIIGGIGSPEQKAYLSSLKNTIKEEQLGETIKFIGPIPNESVVSALRSADLFVSMSRTGSLDKAVIEAMSSGTPVLTSNEAFRKVLGHDAPMLMFPAGDANACASRIRNIKALSPDNYKALSERLRVSVGEKHNIETLVPCILDIISSLKPITV